MMYSYPSAPSGLAGSSPAAAAGAGAAGAGAVRKRHYNIFLTTVNLT